MKKLIKKFKEWLIIKLGGYVSWIEAKTVVNSYTAVPTVYKVSYAIPLSLDDKSERGIEKDLLYAKAHTDILPRISKITSEIIGGRKEYTLTITAIQENDIGE